jgi:hypothetical protein
MEEQARRRETCLLYTFILLQEVKTLEEKPHFSTCFRRLKVSFAIIFDKK